MGFFLLSTPDGLLTKADMVGYAVCHRIPSHSFFIAGRQLPLCARCSGTFLGALIGLVGQAAVLKRRRASGFPPAPILAVLLGFVALWGFDGFNSYMSMSLGRPLLYTPQQWLRLATGTLAGITISSVLWPTINFSLCADPSSEPAVRSWRDLGLLLLMGGGTALLVWSRWPPLLYPLVLLSAAGVLTMLTGVNTVLVAMALGWENRYRRCREAVVPILLGLILSILIIGGIDLLRYSLTGTLEGFPGL
ncbi:MAG TPA: DUF2085 domain-containing protein [Thermoflexia bacterium]|nr:DUF2085 domain-containing protein [Thermoflexia bacterium]